MCVCACTCLCECSCHGVSVEVGGCVCVHICVCECAFMLWCVCCGWRMYVCVCIHVWVCIHAKVCLLEDNFGCWFSPSTFTWVPVIWAQVIRLEQEMLLPRSHFPSLPNMFFNGLSWKWRSVFKIGKHHTMSFSLGFLKCKSTLSYLKRAVKKRWKERLCPQPLMLHHLSLW